MIALMLFLVDVSGLFVEFLVEVVMIGMNIVPKYWWGYQYVILLSLGGIWYLLRLPSPIYEV